MIKKSNTILVLGGDGYFGWNLGLALASRTNANVVLMDSLIKRKWEREVGARTLLSISAPYVRIKAYKKILNKDNLSFEKLNLLNYPAIVSALRKYSPHLVINAAQQPSAPFSMMSPKNTAQTFSNNVIGHLNTLWAITEVDKDISYIKLGSAGCYSGIDADFLPLSKVDLKFRHGRKVGTILQSWLPMHANDFYHQSKISDFLASDLAADVWKMRVATVQQSTIFGAGINENFAPENHSLASRFNYDAVFGTVINRFVCQLAIGEPLTVYGDGEQKTGLISLSDTIENFLNLAQTNLARGEHEVVHNHTTRMSINEVAILISSLSPNAKINYIKNPRKEKAGLLERKVEAHSTTLESHRNRAVKIKKEISLLFNFAKMYRRNINKSIILPKILWQKEEKQILWQNQQTKFSSTMPPLDR
ncbi:MAG: NAD-dependent epimerase/dehydratase family protein [Candidatus Staskawiczbacteria bacterium]|nr:NAD-dependent epimerase/dehydratase family protein [Candidatus Staskawiczbacteria bacterium]